MDSLTCFLKNVRSFFYDRKADKYQLHISAFTVTTKF